MDPSIRRGTSIRNSRHRCRPSERPIPTMTPCSTRGARARVAAKVPQATMAWGLDRRAIPTSCAGWTSLTTAATTTPPRTARGSGSSTSATGRNIITTTPVTRPDQWLCAPDRRFREDRLNEPPTGNPPESAEATLARPWLTNSRSALQGCRSVAANTRAMDAGSAKPTRAMTIPATRTLPVDPHGRSRPRSGKPVGTSPTTGPS